VDSSVAALLLQEAGDDVVAVFMRNGVSAGNTAKKSCCSAADSRDAATVASRLGISFFAIDYAREFSGLIDRFVDEYRRGRTPNPCVLCNQDLKFGQLFSLAESMDAESVATGHYARVESGRLLRAKDLDKDQSYYLFGVERSDLGRVQFPLGDMSKQEVRDRARAAGLVTADKAESMEICFVPTGDYRDLLRAMGEAGTQGTFVDEAGTVLGEHAGVQNFTVGQRRGLPALGTPQYVKELRPASGEVVLCDRDGLLGSEAQVVEVNWLVDPPGRSGIEAGVKIRARSEPVTARIQPHPEGPERVRVEFAQPVSAISPGQAAVFYQGDLVLGGGWLD
jgi:tRNA-specific 2-thiouridylase